MPKTEDEEDAVNCTRTTARLFKRGMPDEYESVVIAVVEAKPRYIPLAVLVAVAVEVCV